MIAKRALLGFAAVVLLTAMSVAAVGQKGPNGPYGPCEGCERIEGVIAEIDYDAMRLVVDTGDALITVQADEDTIIKMGRHGTLTFGDLAVDQTIAASGEAEDGILYAARINIKYRGK